MLKQNTVINKYTEKSGELEGDFFIEAWEMKLWGELVNLIQKKQLQKEEIVIELSDV